MDKDGAPGSGDQQVTANGDLYCLNCGYNLRGLPGDPIRCPECFRLNPRAELAPSAPEAARRFRELLIAADFCVVAWLVFVVFLVPLAVGGGLLGWSVVGLVVLLATVITAFAVAEVGKLCVPGSGWWRELGKYLVVTLTIAVTVPAIWTTCSLLIWGVSVLQHGFRPPSLIHFGVGGALALVVFLAWRPFTGLRARQKARLLALVRAARAGAALPVSAGLRAPHDPGSFARPMISKSLIDILKERFAAAIAKVTGAAAGAVDPQVRAASDPKFGDYQCNAALQLARTLKLKPREVAERVIAAADLADVAEPLEIAGPGFINVRLKADFVGRYLGSVTAPGQATERRNDEATEGADRVGIPPVATPQKVVVDYSSPNIAKQMHVGHLRSTIIGDVFARVLGFEGHEVIRQNHVGDWGTQFGMLIAHYADRPIPTSQTHDDVLQAIEDDYRAAQERFNADAAFAARARAAVGALQGGDADARRCWQQICEQSRHAFTDLYHRLGVLLKDSDARGESFYNDRLAAVVADLREKLPPRPRGEPGGAYAEVREDQGATCVFLYDEGGAPAFRNPDGQELPMIIQKSDGAYLYATTDLAALRFRIQELGAKRLIYVTDARQKLHFQMLFAAARAVGWAGPDVSLEHVPFGSVLGPDRRPLKTREGQNVKLRELLDEAEKRAYELLAERHAGTEARRHEDNEATRQRGIEADVDVGWALPTRTAGAPFTDEEKRGIARRVGVGAVKYADLARDRVSDYVFSWDQMLAMQGNTAPYMLYAYARIRSIYRKAAERIGSADAYAPGVILHLAQPTERALALGLGRLREAIDGVAADLAPHILCSYLYDLASDFMRFYEACPVIQAPDQTTRLSRLRLCDLTARSLKLGLGLLGIEVLERM